VRIPLAWFVLDVPRGGRRHSERMGGSEAHALGSIDGYASVRRRGRASGSKGPCFRG
jgi:hypothetical protein